MAKLVLYMINIIRFRGKMNFSHVIDDSLVLLYHRFSLLFWSRFVSYLLFFELYGRPLWQDNAFA